MAMPAPHLRAELLDRRDRLQELAERAPAPQIEALLHDVDLALERFSAGTYGLCEACGDTIETAWLEVDPLVRFCLDHLSPSEARALEADLELAGRVQRNLLPPPHLVEQGWTIAHHYEPLGTVSGDYCDVVRPAGTLGDLLFLLGDVSGKGVAASMLMAHLSASVRMLVDLNLPPAQVIGRANRVFCESTMPNHYATLVCARLTMSADIEICNAGHCPPLLLRGREVVPIAATGVPIGLFCAQDYSTHRLSLRPGDTLVIYTDGLTEARNDNGEEYGAPRLARLLPSLAGRQPQDVIAACVADAAAFRAGARRTDDLTVMAVQRAG